MNSMFQYLLILDHYSVIQSAQCLGSTPAYVEGDSIYSWVGLSPEQIPGTAWDFSGKVLVWKHTSFQFEELDPMPNTHLILIYQRSPRERLLEAALDLIPDGIQLYDAEGNIQFFNRTFKHLLELPQQENVESQRLLDIFDVNPDYSSTLTALRTRSAVHGRYDSYKSTTGKNLSTVISSYPIIQDGVLLGALTLEEDIKIIQHMLTKYQSIQQSLLRRLSDSTSVSQSTHYTLDSLIGSCPKLLAAKELAAKMAPKDTNILIQGETGTGKEIFAQGIHALSARSGGKLIAVNCAAFPETLIEGMLFGTVKGAFTGSTDKAGLIEEANHGTLFLDELNSMSLGMQAKLLRVLQEGTLQRLGSTKYIPVDVRVISSCNEDAYALSESGKLRKDLFYRLAPVIVEIPPLRERAGDLEVLTWYYIHQNEGLCAQPITGIEAGFWNKLQHHSWPGNVRELFHILYYAISDCEDGVLREQNLPTYFRLRSPAETPPAPQAPIPPIAAGPDYSRGLSALVHEYERALLRDAYLFCGKNATKTAELFQISRQNFQYYMKKYNLNE